MKNTEALRCLLCKKPKCSIQGCPVHTSVPECMQLYREDRLDEAGEILFDNNPLSAITSLVCDWRQFCFGNCVLHVKKMPVRWYQIEQEISERYLFTYRLKRKDNRLKGRRVALVGAGPVGIASAIWLYRAGANVTLFDSNERIGGVLRYGIPGFRLDKKFVNVYERMFEEAGITFQGGVRVGRDLTLAFLATRYDAVIIGAGAEKPATLQIPGEARSIQALPFLKNPNAYELGHHVIVIGAGNVAMDACRTAIRKGADTWIYYRKTYENMPANPIEVEEAQRDGVKIRIFQAPVQVNERSVVFCDCQNVTDPETGKVSTHILEGTEHEVPCDTLITAISEKPEYDVFTGSEPEWNEEGYPLLDENQKVSIPGIDNIYMAGDFILGASTVVQAVASAKTAVNAILNRFAQ